MLATALSALVTGLGLLLIYLIVEGIRRVLKKWVVEEAEAEKTQDPGAR